MSDAPKVLDAEIVESAIQHVIPREIEAVSISTAPDKVLAEAQKAASALKDVLDKKPNKVIFNKEQYIEFEDWQTLGRFYGITAKVESTQFVQFGEVKGFEARALAIDIHTGRSVSAADAMCLNDEPKWGMRAKYVWNNGKREKAGEEPVPLFQLRSMAQTRACAKCLRNVLAWVVVLAGYKPTPAEEMDGVIQQAQIEQAHKKAESIELTSWQDDTIALSGNGLTILASNIEGGLGAFATWLDNSKCWIVPSEDVGRLRATCKKYKVELIDKTKKAVS